ncbi:MAG: TMEM43 family protein [Desulfosarcinaceae bacterium]
METDTYTEVTHESWFARMGKAITGVVVGLLLVVVTTGLLFLNEGRSVRRYRTLDAGQARVVSIAADAIDPRYEGQLVHLGGSATTTKPLKDTEFGLSLTALRLQRVVEMYQWTEDKETKTRKNVGGGKKKTTTYRYRKEWVNHWVDHHRFKKPAGHTNPAEMPYANQDFISINARLGAFRLPPTLVQRIHDFADVDIDRALIPNEAPPNAQRHGVWLYFGPHPGTPAVGDVRVSFRAVYPTWISVVAQQHKDRLTPYDFPAGELVLVKKGEHSAEALFEGARESNAALTWGLRLGGILFMGIGFTLVLGPLATAADVIPLLGAIVGLGAGIAAAILAIGLSMATIAVAWIWYRPLLGIGLLVGCGALAALLWWQGNRRVKGAAGRRRPAPPGDVEDGEETAPPPPPLNPPDFLTPVDAPPLFPPRRNAVDHLNEGIAHLRAENLDAALAAFNSAIQKDAELGAAYFFRGVVQSRRKERDAAVKNLQIAARLGHGKAREALSVRQIAW